MRARLLPRHSDFKCRREWTPISPAERISSTSEKTIYRMRILGISKMLLPPFYRITGKPYINTLDALVSVDQIVSPYNIRFTDTIQYLKAHSI
jgi:hypothetical protein